MPLALLRFQHAHGRRPLHGRAARVGTSCAWAVAHDVSVQEVVMPALAARTVAEVIVELRSVSGIGVVALQAFDVLLQACWESARGV